MKKLPKLYTDFAKYYDKLESQYRDYALETRWLEKLLESHGCKNVIDISCGTGNHISGLVQSALKVDSKREFYAMDASEEMVQVASAKLRKLGSGSEVLLGDFLKMPLRQSSFDSAICMYWSLAGLSHEQVRALFSEVRSILKVAGLFVFDVENSEGIKENLLNEPFIDSFFDDEGKSVIRANLSRKIEPDLVDWHAYYLFEKGGVSELINDNMKLKFYSKSDLSRLLSESGFSISGVYSSPFIEYREHSPSIYFVAQKHE